MVEKLVIIIKLNWKYVRSLEIILWDSSTNRRVFELDCTHSIPFCHDIGSTLPLYQTPWCDESSRLSPACLRDDQHNCSSLCNLSLRVCRPIESTEGLPTQLVFHMLLAGPLDFCQSVLQSLLADAIHSWRTSGWSQTVKLLNVFGKRTQEKNLASQYIIFDIVDHSRSDLIGQLRKPGFGYDFVHTRNSHSSRAHLLHAYYQIYDWMNRSTRFLRKRETHILACISILRVNHTLDNLEYYSHTLV